MSKSKYNVVNPDDIVSSYGADTLRMYEMFLGPLELSKPWNTNGIDACIQVPALLWNLFHDNQGNLAVTTEAPTREELKVLHKTVKKVEEDIERFSFNTSVSEFMICCNELSSLKCNKRAILEPLVIASLLSRRTLPKSCGEATGAHAQAFSTSASRNTMRSTLVENSFEYPISINGRVRAKMNFALDMPVADIEKLVMASKPCRNGPKARHRKGLLLPGRIVNVVMQVTITDRYNEESPVSRRDFLRYKYVLNS